MNIATVIGYILVSLICIMLSVYLGLCFAGWISDIYDDQRRRWKK